MRGKNFCGEETPFTLWREGKRLPSRRWLVALWVWTGFPFSLSMVIPLFQALRVQKRFLKLFDMSSAETRGSPARILARCIRHLLENELLDVIVRFLAPHSGTARVTSAGSQPK